MRECLEFRREKVLRPALIVSLALSVAAPAVAQLSPGLLSEPHAHLEGSGSCQQCHDSRKGVDPAKCLACHELLAARVRAGEGLHAREDYGDCKSCHIDHHGLEFELVWWGEDGIESFDHRLTGFELEAAHANLSCRDCHRPVLLVDEASLIAGGKDPDRTFLGLGRDCLSCHPDEHRNQFGDRSCRDCHSQRTWIPATGFDHQLTRYALTGLHADVECVECHGQQQTGESGDTFRQFVGMAFASCADCHDDPHLGRFGPDCASCHVTVGWSRVEDDSFDHDLTRYPLAGRHRQVDCLDCHPVGEPRSGLSFARCTDCHLDAHMGQLAAHAEGVGCGGCHDVDGFSPALFTVSDHQAVWTLEGAHLAVACNDCHRASEPAALIRAGVATALGSPSPDQTVQLRFASTDCLDCHQDPHGTAVSSADTPGCATCHRVESWRVVSFDHAATGLELVGGHRDLACSACHPTDGGETLRFGGLGTACAGCHNDPHRGQLVDGTGTVACQRCHSEEKWVPAGGFDHDRDAAFQLEGAHRDVACLACHPTESVDGEPIVRYKPVDATCSACHTTEEPADSVR